MADGTHPTIKGLPDGTHPTILPYLPHTCKVGSSGMLVKGGGTEGFEFFVRVRVRVTRHMMCRCVPDG